MFLFVSIQLIACITLWIGFYQDFQTCSQWLSQPVGRVSCFGDIWMELPPRIDYGAGFERNKDAVILCMLEEEVLEGKVHLKCD